MRDQIQTGVIVSKSMMFKVAHATLATDDGVEPRVLPAWTDEEVRLARALTRRTARQISI